MGKKTIVINGDDYHLSNRYKHLSGVQIRALGACEPNGQLVQENAGKDRSDLIIYDYAVVVINGGERFYTQPLTNYG